MADDDFLRRAERARVDKHFRGSFFCLMVSNGDRKRLPLHSKSLKGEMGEMDAPSWLRLVTFGYARLRRATRIDILGWADFEARKNKPLMDATKR